MMYKNELYFYIEPYVYITRKVNNVLLYNTLNGKSLEYNSNVIAKVVSRLLSKKNLYVIKLNNQEKESNELKKFMSNTMKYYMGDLIENPDKKPIQFVPFIKVKTDLERMQLEDIAWQDYNIKHKVFELSVYPNSRITTQKNGLSEIHKQFLFPATNINHDYEIDFDELISLTSYLNANKAYRINLLGDNILKYSRFEEIADHFNNLSLIKVYYFLLEDVCSESFENFIMKLDKHSSLNISIVCPIDTKYILKKIAHLQNIPRNIIYQFIVKNNSELKAVEDFTTEHQISSFLIKPLYSSNPTFFKKFVYLSKREILNTKRSFEKIYTNELINEYEFGKFILMPNGIFYANLNDPPLGIIQSNNLNDIIKKEISTGKS